MERLKISLPAGLRTELDCASAKSGRSIAEEIRSRVEASFAQEAVNKSTRGFLAGVALMAAEIERETGAAWHANAVAHETLSLAIQLWLEPLKQGPTALTSRPYATTSEDDPRKLAALIVHRIRNNPDFTSSATRRWMEEEHQKSRAFLALPFAERLGHPVPPPPGQSPSTSLINEPPQQDKKDNEQQQPKQQKKRAKR